MVHPKTFKKTCQKNIVPKLGPAECAIIFPSNIAAKDNLTWGRTPTPGQWMVWMYRLSIYIYIYIYVVYRCMVKTSHGWWSTFTFYNWQHRKREDFVLKNLSFLFGVCLKGRLFLERECSTTIQDIGTLIILFGEFLQGSILASYLLPGGEATDLLVAAHLLSRLETGKKTHHVNGKLLMTHGSFDNFHTSTVDMWGKMWWGLLVKPAHSEANG